MRPLVLALLMMARLQAVAQTPAPVVPPDWADDTTAARDAMKNAIRAGVRDTLAEEDKTESGRRYQRDGARFGKFGAELEAVPGRPSCLGPNALSRQNTYIFTKLFTLPFLLAAAVTGKCN